MKYCYRLILTILMLSMSFAHLASSQNQSAFSHGVVYSSDRNLQKAKQEIEQLPRRLPQYRDRVGLFKRRQWYVSVVLFPTSSDANRSKKIIDDEYARGTFIVNLQEWCRPDWSKNTGVSEGVNYYDCKRGEIIPDRTGAIIVNNFSKIEDAQSDIEKLKNTFQKQHHNLTIFKRGDSYFTAVINYANEDQANQQIPQNLKNKAKAVNINQWCPRPVLKPVKNPKIYDYIECQQK